MKNELEKLTIAEVKRAYKNLGWTPITGYWHCVVDGKQACCAMSAVVCSHQKVNKKKYKSLSATDIIKLARKRFGEDEVHAFAAGFDRFQTKFDKEECPEDKLPMLRNIFQQARKIRKAIKTIPENQI